MNEGHRPYQHVLTLLERLRPHTALGRYGLALSLPALLYGARIVLAPTFGFGAPYILFIPAVFVVASLTGFKPGVSTTVLSLILGHLLTVPAGASVLTFTRLGVVRTVIFLLAGVFVSKITQLSHLHQRQRAASAAALQDSERRLRLLVEGINDGALLMVEPDGTIGSWNSGAERLLGYQEDDVVNRHVALLYGPDAAAHELAEEQLRQAGAAPHHADHGWRTRKDGSVLWVESTLTALRDDTGRLQGYSLLLRDRTERERQRAEIRELTASLQQRVAELESLLHVLPIGIAIADDPTCLRVRGNAALAALLEGPLPGDARLPTAPEQHYPLAIYHQGRQLELDETPMRAAALQRTTIAGQELQLELPSGRRREVLAFATPLVDHDGAVRGAVAAFLDVAEQKQAEEALRASEARLAALLASAMDAIIAVDEAQHIVVFNPAAESLFGYTATELSDQPLTALLPDIPGTADDHWTRTGTAAASPVEWLQRVQSLTGRHADGSTFRVEATLARTDGPGATLYTAIIRDVTLRERAEAERTERLRAEQAARLLAEDAVQLREVFLSIAAHELKTPLTALLGFVHVLSRRLQQRAELDDRERRALQGIEEQGERLGKLVETLLDFSRMQRGALVLDLQPVDMGGIVTRVAAQLGPTLGGHTLHLQQSGEPALVMGDELRLEQVLQNLVQNAAKYSPDGSPILVRQQQHGTMAVIAVTDQGIGIPEAAQRRLFSQFFRASNVDQRRVSGLGLGLYLVNEIVQAHGGTISVSSREGFGSTFTVRIPLSSPQQLPAVA